MPPYPTARDAITQIVFVADEPRPVDLAIVLGSKYDTTMDRAIELYQRGWTPKILVTGHGPDEGQERNECEAFCNYAIERGVPAEALLREDSATNTKENFCHSGEIIEREFGWETVRTVSITCKPFHSRRALMTAQRYWPQGIELVMLPSNDPRDLQPDSWWQSEWGRWRVLEEVRRIGEYAVKGDLAY